MVANTPRDMLQSLRNKLSPFVWKNHSYSRGLSSILLVILALIASQLACYALPSIGAALKTTVIGREIQMEYTVENIGDEAISSVALNNNLDTVFGAGNYSVTSAPAFLLNPSGVTLNTNFNGSGDSSIITSGDLAIGAKAVVTVVAEISAVADLGSGLGVYSNQVTVTGNASVQVSDLSDSGSIVDSNDNDLANDTGESDPTAIHLLSRPLIGGALDVSLSGTTATFDYYLEAFGNTALSNVSVLDDLDAVFGAGNYAVTSGPIFIDDPASLVVNTNFDGSADTELFLSGGLALGDTAQVRVIVNVTNVTDQGAGLGVYEDQAQLYAENSTGKVTEDLSDMGAEPDASNDGNPNQNGENDVTSFVIGEEPVVGISLTGSVNGSDVTLDYFIENLGNTLLNSLTLENDLDAVFGASNYYIQTAPVFVDDPGTVALDPSYNGRGNNELFLIGNSSLAIDDTVQVRMVVRLLTIADVGLGVGMYRSQVSIEANAPGGALVTDLSDDGTDPDPNGNGNPSEAGEDDAALISVAQRAAIGIAKTYSLSYLGALPVITMEYRVENLGNVALTNITIDEDLNAIYGAGNYIHQQDPSAAGGANTFSYNSAYDGSSNTALLTSGTLNTSEYVVFRISHLLVTVTDQGSGNGIYPSNTTVNATDPLANPVSDVSHVGNDVDPNDDGDASDHSAPTVVDVTSSFGIALDAAVSGNEVTFDLYLESFSSQELSDFDVFQGLGGVFGSENYSISSAPTWIDDPGSMTLNAGYDGSASDRLINAGGTLASNDTAQLRFVVTVDSITNQGAGIGVFSSQLTAYAKGPSGEILSDDSVSGSDPDANADENPSNDTSATPVVLAVDSVVGVSLNAIVTGTQATLDIYLEHYGAGSATAIDLPMDLDGVFGASNYTVSAGPTLVDDPGTLVLNSSYNGSGNTGLLTSGSLSGTGTAQIQLVVDLTNVTDQGNGLGDFLMQLEVSHATNSGLAFSDLSDSGTNPDGDDNDDPSEESETSLVFGESAIGLSHITFVTGNQVTLRTFVENLGGTKLENVLLNLPANPVFGSGNYSVLTQPTLVEGPSTLGLSGQYFGFSVFDRLVAGGTLEPGDRVVFDTVFTVTNETDQGNGLGVYQISTTISADDKRGGSVSDTSDLGIYPDPNNNGNAGDANEDDVTLAIIGDEAILGASIDMNSSGIAVTLDLYFENLGSVALQSIDFELDLDAVFGAGNYSITSPLSFVDDPATLVLNSSYTGSGVNGVLSSGSLSAADTAQVRLVVNVDTVTNMGFGTGTYQAQVTTTASSALGSVTYDITDDGIDPDSDGGVDPNEVGENDPSIVALNLTRLGLALNAAVDGKLITLDYYVSNLTNQNETITGLSLPVDLDSLFGAGNYQIVSGPDLVSAPRDVTVNLDFDGISDTALILGSVGQGVTDQVRLVIQVSELVDAGSGLGVYSTQATVSGLNNVTPLLDISDEGIVADTDGNGFAGNTGEDDPTIFTIAEDPSVGVAMTADVVGRQVTFNVYFESFANVSIDNLAASMDLSSYFGAGNFTVSTNPFWIDNPGSVTVNSGYNGATDTALLTSGTMAIGETAQLRLIVDVIPTDQGAGSGIYSTSLSFSAQSPDGTTASDLSDDGIDPDPNGNGDSDETGENDATQFGLNGSIGDFVWNDLDGDGVQDGGEPSLVGVIVYVDANGNNVRELSEANATTDIAGFYQFEDLSAASYLVRVDATTLPSGFVQTGGTAAVTVELGAGEENTTVDFGYQQQNASIGDFVWGDIDGDGSFDGSDAGLVGVTVYLDLNSNGTLDGGEPSTVTSASGAYDFTGLATGVYSLRVDEASLPTGFALTGGANPVAVSLAAGEDYNSGDFGYQQQNATIGDFVWNDLDGDGVQDGGEPGLVGVTMYIDSNTNGSIDALEPRKITDAAGAYAFTSLPKGDYEVRVDTTTLISGSVLTSSSAVVSLSLAAGQDFNTADFGYREEVDLAVSVTGPAGAVTAGSGVENLEYELTVTNNGPASATTLKLNELLTLPSGVSLVSATPTQGTITSNVWTVGSLASGASAKLAYIITVGSSAAAGTDVTGLSASVASADQAIVDTSDDSAAELTSVERSVDIALSVTESIDPVIAGSGASNLVYTITAQNTGDSDASGVSVSRALTLPSGVSVVSEVASAGTFSSPNWTIPTLGSGQSVSLTVTLTVASNTVTSTDGIGVSAALETVAETQTSTANDSAAEATSATRQTDIVVEVAESAATVVAGSGLNNLVYTVTVRNDGPSDASDLSVSNVIVSPSGVTLEDRVTSVGSLSGTTWTIGDLASGASASLTVELTVESSALAGTAVVKNTASVISLNESLINTTDDTAFEATDIEREVDIVVTVSESIETVIAGSGVGNLVYTVTARNAGPSDASAVSLSNVLTLPAEVSLDSAVASVGIYAADEWSVGSLAAGESETLELTLTVGSSAVTGTNVIQNAAALTNVTEPLINTGNDTSLAQTNIDRNVDIVLSVSESVQTAIAGSGSGNLVYIVTARNDGPSDASTVRLSHVITTPTEVNVDSVAASLGTYSGGAWAVGDLPSGSSATLTVTITVGSLADEGVDVVSVLSTVTGVNELLINTADDSAFEATSILATIDITVEVSSLVDVLVAGGESLEAFELTVTNNGPSVAASLELETSLSLPAGVTVVSTDLQGEPSVYTTATGTWAIASLSVNGTATLRVTINADANTVAGLNTIGLQVDSASAVQTIVTAAVDYQLSATASVISAQRTPLAVVSTLTLNHQNGLIEGLIRVTNNNPVSMPAFRIYVTGLPADVSVLNATGSDDWAGNSNVPYFLVNTPTPGNGGVREILAQYYRATRVADFTPIYEIELLDTEEVAAVLNFGTSVDLTRSGLQLSNGTVMIEWVSTVGQEYAVQYSSDLSAWKTVSPTVTASGTATQWMDSGPPQTDAPPSSVSQRFYRVFKINR